MLCKLSLLHCLLLVLVIHSKAVWNAVADFTKLLPSCFERMLNAVGKYIEQAMQM